MAVRDQQFKYEAETVMMLGMFNPWTLEDTEVFKRALQQTGQVSIGIRQVIQSERWPHTPDEIVQQIHDALTPYGFYPGKHFIVGTVPNVVRMSAGPKKDYTDGQTMLDTPPPDNKFKMADLPEDPFKDEEWDENEAGSIEWRPDIKHEDWDEG